MDEMNMIRTLLTAPAPSGDVVAEGRERLRTADARPRTRPARSRWGFAGLGLTAVAACAALAVALTGSATPDRTPSGPPRPMTAQQVLLAAATKAEAEPPGRYWHTHVINGQAYYIANGGYVISGANMEIDSWTARSDKVSNVFRSRFAGASPQTAADNAAWKRAGSPRQWTVLSNGGHIPQTTQSEKWQLTGNSPAEKKAMKTMLARAQKECQARPTTCPPIRQQSPEALEKLVSSPSSLARQLRTPGGKGNVIHNAGDLLTQPLSPTARAKVFRAIAAVPGIRKIDRTTDLRGRTAIALVSRQSDGGDTFDTELLLAPRTYQLLGTQTVLVKGGSAATKGMKPGTIYTHELFVEMGWTNTAYGG
jgi:hypothetical protein